MSKDKGTGAEAAVPAVVGGVSDEMALAMMADLGINVKDELEGVTPSFPEIGIIHQAQMFSMPNGQKVDHVKCAIVDISTQNAWWEVPFDQSGGGTPPDCYSLDGIRPDAGCENPQSESCHGCERNKFGSDGGRGKACKNMKRVFVLLPGEMLPCKLTVPPSNLKAVDNYVISLTSKGLSYKIVETEVYLRPAKNKEGIEYSEIAFQRGAVLEPDYARAVVNLAKEMKGAMRGTFQMDSQVH